MESVTAAKVAREVELMKRDEEMQKKVEMAQKKESDARVAMTHFQKGYNEKINECAMLQEELEKAIAQNKLLRQFGLVPTKSENSISVPQTA